MYYFGILLNDTAD